mmetsp:Transcript_34179/g.74128  ORF Transcript_34179/g.74128 Transcript_34179/m.74128 type:complete len:308 (+) Transcript_34179:613-1536(+)
MLGGVLEELLVAMLVVVGATAGGGGKVDALLLADVLTILGIETGQRRRSVGCCELGLVLGLAAAAFIVVATASARAISSKRVGRWNSATDTTATANAAASTVRGATGRCCRRGGGGNPTMTEGTVVRGGTGEYRAGGGCHRGRDGRTGAGRRRAGRTAYADAAASSSARTRTRAGVIVIAEQERFGQSVSAAVIASDDGGPCASALLYRRQSWCQRIRIGVCIHGRRCAVVVAVADVIAAAAAAAGTAGGINVGEGHCCFSAAAAATTLALELKAMLVGPQQRRGIGKRERWMSDRSCSRAATPKGV